MLRGYLVGAWFAGETALSSGGDDGSGNGTFHNASTRDTRPVLRGGFILRREGGGGVGHGKVGVTQRGSSEGRSALDVEVSLLLSSVVLFGEKRKFDWIHKQGLKFLS